MSRKSKKIICHCGQEIICSGFTNTCDCGSDYNWNGDLLASHECWGEEAGESISDILRIDSMSTDDLLNGDC